ncbi:MAG: tRNA pseudouridine(38-40) synthase TruA [Actinobacteria bacterium]|nr:tRNA pseudouridine(38-40) synthase TruA [Actinomycetota bacterium]
MRNIRLLVQYDGTNYHGFQVQLGHQTIQSKLEEALETVTGARPRVTGSGRTDAGVHALGQVVNFRTEGTIPTDRIPFALNAVLPPDIIVKEAAEVPPDFHARFSARSKVYRYTIYNDVFPTPFWRLYSYHWREPVNVAAMRQAAAHLIGRHDFAAFKATGSSAKTTVRTVLSFEITVDGPLIHLTVEADGFLYNMVRIMAGTLLDVGVGKIRPSNLPHVIESRNRDAAGRTLPPHGLCLMRVNYQVDRSGSKTL